MSMKTSTMLQICTLTFFFLLIGYSADAISSFDQMVDEDGKMDQGRSLFWKTDPEFTMLLISNTLGCIFVGLQLHHVKKNPQVLSFISLVMLVILTLGHMIPLALDFDTLCFNKQDQHKVLSLKGGSFELREAILTVTMVVAFLLLLRLLQLTVSARSHYGNQKSLWTAEEITALVVLFLYGAAAKVALVATWGKYEAEDKLLISSHLAYQEHPICNDVKSYAGLVLDGFLFPQLLLNMFSNSKRNALSFSFYSGTTFVRLLPHAYDLYRNHSHVSYNRLQISDQVFSSVAGDAIIVLGLLLLAAIIYLQQKIGGDCILPTSFREIKAYTEELPEKPSA